MDDTGTVGRPKGSGACVWEDAVACKEDLAGQGQGYGHGQCCGTYGLKIKDKELIPVTKLGCMVKGIEIKYLPAKESEITDFFLEASLKVLKIIPL